MNKFIPSFTVIFLTLIIFFLTKNPLTSFLKLQMLMVSLLILLGYSFYIRKRSITEGSSIHAYLVFTAVLFLVGSTGWFFSPFFFTLYLLGIFLAFIFSTAVALSFITTLVVIFSFNIGEVNLVYDFLVVLSLLTVIPVTMYLRKEYLRLKEAQKTILVLEKEKEHYRTKVEEVLANTLVNFGANLRQPINDVKQLTYRLSSLKDKKQKDLYEKRIVSSSEEALRLLKEFEEKATGKKLLTTPKNS